MFRRKKPLAAKQVRVRMQGQEYVVAEGDIMNVKLNLDAVSSMPSVGDGSFRLTGVVEMPIRVLEVS